MPRKQESAEQILARVEASQTKPERDPDDYMVIKDEVDDDSDESSPVQPAPRRRRHRKDVGPGPNSTSAHGRHGDRVRHAYENDAYRRQPW